LPAGLHFLDAAAPDGMRLYAIGDVHGRLDCLTRMHEMIAAEIDRDSPEDWRIIHLGDYVDRGPQSREVLDFLAKATAHDPRMIALMGNHDEGFLDFLANPTEARLFLDYGGLETAASYGVVLDASSRGAIFESHRQLLSAMPEKHLAFLHGLKRHAEFGDFFFCHAGVRPEVALADQDPHDLIWIRREFLNHPGLYERVIVHGHTPQAEPEVMPNRVNVDTKAFDTGRLTALVLEGDTKRFIHAQV
jgi:serine/threonine protein phosphatase 1